MIFKDEQWRAYLLTLRKTRLEEVDAIERLLEMQRTAEIRKEYNELMKKYNDQQKPQTVIE